jgi:ribosomal protein S8E
VNHLSAMRITKLPIPLLIAAAALTSVAVIYVYLTAPPMPIHTDPNFTQPLYVGGVYLWRGAAFEYIFSADNTITLSSGAPYHLIYLFGPLYNISLGSGKVFIIYGAGIRPLYVVKHTVESEDGYRYNDHCLVFKLKEVTPQNMTIANLTLYLPEVFDINDVLTNKEDSVVYNFGNCLSRGRVIYIQANGTHIKFQFAYTHSPILTWRGLIKLDHITTGKTIRVTNKPLSGTYIVGGTTFTVMALPYLHFAIVPQDTTTLTVYVR